MHFCLNGLSLARSFLVAAAALAIAPAPATAALIIDTGGDQQPGGYPLLNRNPQDLSWQAFRFNLPYDATITGITNLIGGFQAGAYTISIATSANLNGPNLHTANSFAALNPVGGGPGVRAVDQGQWFGRLDLNWQLTAGDYWVKLEVPDVGFDGFLRAGTMGGSFFTARRNDTPPAYLFTGEQSVAFRLYGTPGFVPGVPEPESWALMIAGFGLVGAVARRRAAAA
jgi:hypothetical protein